jgi:hypothetical protein
MPRKQLTNLKSSDKLLADAIEQFHGVSEVKYELAKEAYAIQDIDTKAVIDRIAATLRQHANGYIQVQLDPPRGALVPVKIENEYLGMNLLWLAIEIVKDLAFVGIRVAKFKFPEQVCAQCGVQLPETTSARKAGRR